MQVAGAGDTKYYHPYDEELIVHFSENITIKEKKKNSYKGGKIKAGYGKFPPKTRWEMIT